MGYGMWCIEGSKEKGGEREREREREMKVVMMIVLVVVVGMLGKVKMGIRAEVSEEECKEERRIGIDLCKPVVYGNDPTPACCERVRLTHVECVCPMITPKLAPLIDVNRAVRLIDGCGRKVPRHFKCGAITTP